jgi:hypothetical protein
MDANDMVFLKYIAYPFSESFAPSCRSSGGNDNDLLISFSHPAIAERVNAKHHAEVDPEAPSQDRPPLLQQTSQLRGSTGKISNLE